MTSFVEQLEVGMVAKSILSMVAAPGGLSLAMGRNS